MSEQQGTDPRFDPSGNTEAFQAFARDAAPQLPAEKRSPMALAIGILAVVIIVAAVIILLAT